MVNIAHEIGCSKGCHKVIPMGKVPCAGVPVSSTWQAVPVSKVSGKVVWGDPSTEVSQTTVSVLTPNRVEGRLNRNHIQRLSGRMR